MQFPHRRRQRGLTLLELLAVMAILAILVASFLPAVLQSLEASRRAQCQNNLRQLGIGLHNFHSAHRRFPAGTENEWSWCGRILPMIEQNELFNGFDFDREPFEDPNLRTTDRVISLLQCPSDSRSDLIHEQASLPGMRFAHTSYLGSLGSDNKDGQRGMFEEYGSVRMRQVNDGSSQTLFVGERGVVEAEGESYGWWVWGPETVLTSANGFHRGQPTNAAAAEHWWSHHPGGGNFLFVDGSVQFLSYDIDPEVFHRLATRDGNDVVPSF